MGLAQLRDPPGAACRPCGRRRPNNSLALRARYPNWSNPKVQDPSMFGSKFLFAWQVCLSSKSVRGVCVCIYSLYYKGVRKSKFLTKFAPYVAIIMCHFALGLDSTFEREEERRGEVLSRRLGSGVVPAGAGPRSASWMRPRGGLPRSVHGRHLVLMEAELFGFEAQAGDAVGHVHPLGGRRGPAGAVGRHSAAGGAGRNEARPPGAPTPRRLPSPHRLLPLRASPTRAVKALRHFYVAGRMWEPLEVCARRPCRWLLESWEPKGPAPPPAPRCGKGQHEARRAPGGDQPLPGPKTHGGCSAGGRGCAARDGVGSQNKPGCALVPSSFDPQEAPRVLSSGTGLPRSWGRSLPRCPVPVGACTHLYGEVLVQERYSGLSAVGRGAMGCSMAASWL